MKPKTKGELLEHYCTRDPVHFVQYDAFMNAGYGMPTECDKEGDWISGGETYELMTGNYSVRVLISDGVSKVDALRALKKIRGWIKQFGILDVSGAYHNIYGVMDITPQEDKPW